VAPTLLDLECSILANPQELCTALIIIYHTPRSPADHHSAKDATQSHVRGDSLKIVLMNIPMKDYMPLADMHSARRMGNDDLAYYGQ
jgi:hypothetical protein